MAELATVAAVASLASGALTAVGTIAAGNAAKQQGQLQNQMSLFEAKQMEIKANDEFGAAQQRADQLGRQKRLALSTLQSRAAGSGFTATDPSTLALADEIETYGSMQEGAALFGGERAQADLRTGAGARRYEGAIADSMGRFKQTQSYLSAGGTILGSIANAGMNYKYGQARPAPAGGYRYG
jgi:hypothetical protein